MNKPPKTIEPRDIWLVRLVGVESEKERRAVVIAVNAERVTVVYGQSAPGPAGHIRIDPASGDGRRFRLEKTTYFRSSNVEIVTRDDLLKKLGTCSRERYPDFVSLTERFFAERHIGASSAIKVVAPLSAADAVAVRLSTTNHPTGEPSK